MGGRECTQTHGTRTRAQAMGPWIRACRMRSMRKCTTSFRSTRNTSSVLLTLCCEQQGVPISGNDAQVRASAVVFLPVHVALRHCSRPPQCTLALISTLTPSDTCRAHAPARATPPPTHTHTPHTHHTHARSATCEQRGRQVNTHNYTIEDGSRRLGHAALEAREPRILLRVAEEMKETN